MSRDSDTSNAPSSDRLTTIRNGLLAIIAILLLAILSSLLILGRRQPSPRKEETGVAGIATDAHTDTENQSEHVEQAAVSPISAVESAQAPSAANDPAPIIPGIALPHMPSNLFGGEGPAPISPFGPPRGKVRIPISPADEAAILAEDAKIPRERTPTGPTASVSLFGSPAAVGVSFVFVIDRSASMGGEGLGAIQAAAKEFASQLNQLTSEQTFQVVAYNQAADYLTQRELIPATAENKQELVHFVANLAAFGQTEHLRGLRAALRLKPEVIFLLTDGGDPVLKPGQLREIGEEASGRTAIHCLHFAQGPPSDSNHFLARLAAENNGHYRYIDMNAR